MYVRSKAICRALALSMAVALWGTVGVFAGEARLVPGGNTVGIKLFSQGVMVVKLPEGASPARSCGLEVGDVILQCGGTAVTSTEQFQSLLQKKDTTDLTVQRQEDTVTLQVSPQESPGGSKTIGAWVRDSMAGIGTMTYYDPESGAFGALGHGITDVDTALLMPFDHGSILPSTVKAVKRGAPGSAGELRGDFDLSRTLGVLSANTAQGIFGVLEEVPQGEALPIGTAVEGMATIRSNVSGTKVEEYDIEIMKVTEAEGRELVIAIRDPELLRQTGGIVQGQSGSPILQNGCIVGAVTHVLLHSPASGYGITIQTMLEAAEQN